MPTESLNVSKHHQSKKNETQRRLQFFCNPRDLIWITGLKTSIDVWGPNATLLMMKVIVARQFA